MTARLSTASATVARAADIKSKDDSTTREPPVLVTAAYYHTLKEQRLAKARARVMRWRMANPAKVAAMRARSEERRFWRRIINKPLGSYLAEFVVTPSLKKVAAEMLAPH